MVESAVSARQAAHPDDPPSAKSVMKYVELLVNELALLPRWTAVAASHPSDIEATAALQAWAPAIDGWAAKVRGPPLAARFPVELDLPAAAPSPAVLSSAGPDALAALRKAAARLEQYASYRSSFPATMRDGYDQRLREVLAGADSVAAALDGLGRP